MPKRKKIEGKKKSEVKKAVINPEKKISKDKIETKPEIKTAPQPANVDKILIENMLGLQKVIITLSMKLDGLTNQISQLLNLFEISAKSINQRGAFSGGMNDNRILEKLDNIIDQNKTLARGVSLLHEPSSTPVRNEPMPQPIPKPDEDESIDFGNYQKSISSNEQKFNPLPKD